MSAEANQVEAEVQRQASELGWVPKDQFRGDPNNFVDAKTYLERGKQYIPFIKSQLRHSEERLTAVQGENAALKQQVTAATESVAELKKFNREAAVAELRAERRQLRADLIQARKDGDMEKELEIQEKLDDVDDRVRQQQAPPAKANGNGTEGAGTEGTKPPVQDFTQRPEWQQFTKDNPWWESDPAMRGAAVAIMKDMADKGQLEGLSPSQRFSKVAAATKQRFGLGAERPTDSKVEGGGGPSGGGGSGKSFSDLPQDARAACDRMGKRLVGEGRAFKTEAEWRAHYVQNYAWE